MTEEVPAAPTMPECNGNLPPEKGPLQVIDEIVRSVGMAPYANAETGPDAPPAKENQQENRNSLSEDIVRGDFDGEKRCQDKPEENGGRLQQGSAQTQDAGSDGREPQEGPGGEGTPSGTPPGTPAGSGGTGTAAGTLPASADGRGDAAEEEEEEEEELEEEEEEDTEEDEVQVLELKKEKEEAPRPEQGSGREPAPPAPPGPNSPAEKPGEQPGPGKKNDISRHSYSRYNTISYRRIRKGNTKQRIDEFESMMHL